MAWAGDALAQLYSVTGRKAYLDGAVAIGDWIQAHCRDARGPGGYTGGYTGPGGKIEWKSTEHNIDVYAFFRLLARETGNPVWSSRSAWAQAVHPGHVGHRGGPVLPGHQRQWCYPGILPGRSRTSAASRIWLSGTPRTSNRSTGKSATWP